MTMDKADKADTLEKTDTSLAVDKKSDVTTTKTSKLKKLAKLEKQDSGSLKSEKIDRSESKDNAKHEKKSDKADKSDKHEKLDNGAVNGLINGEAGSEDGEGLEVQEEMLDEEKEKLLKVLMGELENLPPLGSKIVRIFTSSTFTGNEHLYDQFDMLD